MNKMIKKRRYGVERCDECGTLFRADGTPIDHTWSVVDRTQIDSDGHAREVSNHDTRAAARAEAAELSRADLGSQNFASHDV